MSTIHERIKGLRTQMHLSQDYVAQYLGMNRSTFTQLENGNRKILAEDIKRLSTLFGVSSDFILYGTALNQTAAMFAKSFENLDEADQIEIINLLRFKEQMRLHKIVL